MTPLNLLVAIPIRATLPPGLKAQALALVHALEADEKTRQLFNVTVGIYESLEAPPDDAPPFSGIAMARNALLQEFLTPKHDAVLWIDADVVDYPPDLPVQLWETNPGGITAPMILIEGRSQFYDTYCFVENGQRAAHMPPYFTSADDMIEMDCVGTCYIAPASLFRGFEYRVTPYHADHGSLMVQAQARGVRICCTRRVVVYHADLSGGEGWHI